MIPVGIIFIVSKVKETVHREGRILLPLSKIVLAVWPIILAISISAIFSMRLIVAVAIALILLLAWERPRWNQVREVLKEALAPSLFMLVFGILSFQELLEISNAVSSIPRLTLQFGLPPGVIIFALTFSVGLLTGMVTAFIGLSYPLLSGYLYQPEINFGNIYFAFLSGYLGMMLSPTHFCLILTNEYFKANLARVYRLLAPPLLTLFLLGTLLYIVGYPWRIFG
jgi:integral membrane protein (TIGR00529 family)